MEYLLQILNRVGFETLVTNVYEKYTCEYCTKSWTLQPAAPQNLSQQKICVLKQFSNKEIKMESGRPEIRKVIDPRMGRTFVKLLNLELIRELLPIFNSSC